MPQKLIARLKKPLNSRGKTIGILGLSYIPDTNDIRESYAIPIVQTLVQEWAQIIAYDPRAMQPLKTCFPGSPMQKLQTKFSTATLF